MKVINNKWIFKVKTNADGSLDKLKARLVARGFEQFVGWTFLRLLVLWLRPLPYGLSLLLLLLGIGMCNKLISTMHF